MPRVRVAYWRKKFRRNVQRDEENYAQLKALGWKVIVIWECQIEKGAPASSAKDGEAA